MLRVWGVWCVVDQVLRDISCGDMVCHGGDVDVVAQILAASALGEAVGQTLASVNAASVSGSESQHDAKVMVEGHVNLVIVGEIQDAELARQLKQILQLDRRRTCLRWHLCFCHPRVDEAGASVHVVWARA